MESVWTLPNILKGLLSAFLGFMAVVATNPMISAIFALEWQNPMWKIMIQIGWYIFLVTMIFFFLPSEFMSVGKRV